MVQNNSENWKDLIGKFLEIESISVTPMSDFFGELDYYFESYGEPSEDIDLNAKEIELEQSEKTYRKVANAPTTTTTTTSTPTTTSATSTTTTTMRPIAVQTKTQIDSLHLDKSDSVLHGTDQPNTFVDDNELMMEDEAETERKPKIDKSMAVWVVAGALVATVLICIVAIFGRRRCARTPKNRRYV